MFKGLISINILNTTSLLLKHLITIIIIIIMKKLKCTLVHLITIIIIIIMKKLKCTLVQALRFCTSCTAHRGVEV